MTPSLPLTKGWHLEPNPLPISNSIIPSAKLLQPYKGTHLQPWVGGCLSADHTGPSPLADDNPAPGETTISSSDGSAGKESACNAEEMGDADLIPE